MRKHKVGDTVAYKTFSAGTIRGVIGGLVETFGGPGYVLTFPDGSHGYTTDRAIMRDAEGVGGVKRVQTPHGVGILADAANGQGRKAGYSPHVVVKGLPAIPYDPATMPLLEPESRNLTDEDVQRWMDEHSTPATRRKNEQRVQAFRKKATAPGTVRADKYIGMSMGNGYVVTAKLGGEYVIENAETGSMRMRTPREVKHYAEIAEALKAKAA